MDKTGQALNGYYKNKRIIRITSSVLIVIVLLIPVVVFLLALSSTSELKIKAQVTERETDAFSVLYAVSQYIETYSSMPITTQPGVTPHTINICGSSCNNYTTTGTLSYYPTSPQVISFQAYNPNLVVPLNDIYIVDHATCNSASTNIGQQTKNDVALVLYRAPGDSHGAYECMQTNKQYDL